MIVRKVAVARECPFGRVCGGIPRSRISSPEHICVAVLQSSQALVLALLVVVSQTLLLTRTMIGGAKRPPVVSPDRAAPAAPKRPCLEARERRMLALLVQTCNEVNEKIKDPKKHVPIRFDMGVTNRSKEDPFAHAQSVRRS